MHILIVDDEPLVLMTLAHIFARQGYHVDTAQGAVEGLELALRSRPDLVLCDIDMPGRSGIELMTDLGRELPTTPVLVLTGYYSLLHDVEEVAGGMQQRVDVMTKPCQPMDLLKQAGTLLAVA